MRYATFIFWNIAIILMSSTTAIGTRYVDAQLGWLTYQSYWSIGLGLLLILIGLWLRYHSTKHFHEHRVRVVQLSAQHHLITDGPFAWSRNPLILAITIIFLGATLVIGSMLGLVVVFGFQLFWHLWVMYYEEPSLQQQFTSQYIDYCRRVPRWLPFPSL